MLPLSSESGEHLPLVQSASVVQSGRHSNSVALLPTHDMPSQQYARPGPQAPPSPGHVQYLASVQNPLVLSLNS